MYYDLPKGLEFIGEVEWNDYPYEFDLTGVWKNKEGYWIASDSGCSCPTPFDNHRFPDDFEGPFTFHEAAANLQEQEFEITSNAQAQVVNLIQRLR